MVDAGKSSPRFCEAVHKSENNWVSPCAENDGDLCGRPPRRYCAVFRICIDQVDSLLFKTFRCFLGCLCIALPISDTKSILFSLFKPQLAETKPKPVNDLVPRFAQDKDTKTVDFRLLRLSGRAKSKQHGGKGKNSNFSLHVFPALSTRHSSLAPSHLITLSARASTFGGIVRPICF